MKKKRSKEPIQPVSGTKVPRFAGPSTFARLPELRDVEYCDVAIVGIPFDAGTSYRPGARFGPQSIRQASRHLRTNYHPNYDVEPFKVQQVADAGDITCNPFNIDEAIKQIEEGALDLLKKTGGIISLGGDHTIAFPLLKAVNKINNGPVALVHFDAHLDTWDTYFGAPYTMEHLLEEHVKKIYSWMMLQCMLVLEVHCIAEKILKMMKVLDLR